MGFSVGAKLTSIFLLIFLFIIAFGVYSFSVSKSALRDAVGQSSVLLAESMVENIDKDIFLKIEQVQLYTQDVPLQKALVQSNRIFEDIEDRQKYILAKDNEWITAGEKIITPFMREIIENKISDSLRREFGEFWEQKYNVPLYGEAFVTNRYGVNIAQTGKTSDYWQADERWWQEAKDNGFSVGEIEYDESAMAWTTPMGVRINDDQGNFLGVIKTVPIILELVRGIEFTAKEYQTLEVHILTTKGRLVYATETFVILEDASERNLFKKIEPENSFFVAEDEEGEKLFAYAHSKGFGDFVGFGWILVIEYDTAEIFASARGLQNTFVAVGIVLLAIIAFFALTFVRAISIPIKKLTEGANRIAEGDLTVKIDVHTKDEIGQLAHSFNKMASELRRSYQNLEEKVQMRTKELEERVKELDITAKLLVRRDLERLHLNDELQELDKAKSHFVSIAAHQLRTPLSIMKWTFRMLLSGDFGPLAKDQRDVIQRGYDVNEATIKLISDLLDVARIEAGRFVYHSDTISIKKIVHDVVDMNQPYAKENKINMFISENASTEIPLTQGDDKALRGVLQNLISNAINYTLPGGKIELTYKKKGDFIEVRIKDTGIGIPQHQLTRVFTKFFRADNVVRMDTSGTGLGLFIAKNIISGHKGEMGMESQEGKGSTFWFTIPIKNNAKNTNN